MKKKLLSLLLVLLAAVVLVSAVPTAASAKPYFPPVEKEEIKISLDESELDNANASVSIYAQNLFSPQVVLGKHWNYENYDVTLDKKTYTAIVTISPYGYTFDNPNAYPTVTANGVEVEFDYIGDHHNYYALHYKPITITEDTVIKVASHVHEYTNDYIDDKNGETHSDTCICGAKTNTNNHEYTNNYIDNEDGTHTGVCICGATTNSVDHSYVYSHKDDDTHTVTCQNCDYEDSAKHSFGDYSHNGDGSHSRTCNICKHEFTDDCTYEYTHSNGSHTGTCKACKHEITDECDYEYTHNNGSHTGTCEVCKHEFTDECDYEYTHNNGSHTGTCKVCKHEFTDDCTHEYTHNNGSHTGKCDICKHEFTDDCTYEYTHSNGSHTGKCDICKHEFTDDCTYEYTHNNGSHTGTCEVCKHEFTDDCTYEYTHSNGSHTGKCDICKHEFTDDCNFGAYIPNDDATHSRTCDICEDEITDDCVYTHAYISNDDGTHTGKCICDNVTVPAECTYVNGYCSACGYPEPTPEPTYPELYAISLEVAQATTFDAIVNGQPLPDVSNLSIGAEIQDIKYDPIRVYSKSARWVKTPKTASTPSFEYVNYDETADTDAYIYALEVSVFSSVYLVDESTFGNDGSGIYAKDGTDMYMVVTKSFAQLSDLEERNLFTAVLFPTPDDEPPVTPEPPTPEPPTQESPSSSSSSSTVKVPVSNDNNSVDVKASVSGKDATIKPLNDDQIDEILSDEEAAGNVVIDMSDLGKKIDTAGIPKESLEAILEAAEDHGNDTEHLVIKLSTAELILDDASMRAIVDQAEGSIIKFNFDDVGLSRLNKEQKEAIQDMDVRKGYEAYITVNGKRISDFEGGKVEIILPYAVPAGELIEGFSVWYIDEDGELEKQKSTYDGKEKCFVVSHFSDYIITYSEQDALAGSYAACLKDADCPVELYADADPAYWYHNGVHFCIEKNLMQGVDDTNFAPYGTTTRAQLVTILWRLENMPQVEDGEDFNDVYEGDWYYNAIRWASANNIVGGYDNGNFGPKDSITREQTVAILWRYAKYKGYDVSVGEDTNILSYGDAFDIAHYAIPAMQWACGAGVMEGISDSNGLMNLQPQGSTTRAQMATMIMRFCVEIEK